MLDEDIGRRLDEAVAEKIKNRSTTVTLAACVKPEIARGFIAEAEQRGLTRSKLAGYLIEAFVKERRAQASEQPAQDQIAA